MRQKNNVYKVDTYYQELSEIERRIKFVRGFALACFLLFNALIVVGIYRIVTSKRKLLSVTVPGAILLIILFLLARYTYTSQEESYTKKTFGYFLVIDRAMSPLMNPSQEDLISVNQPRIMKTKKP